MPSQRGTGQTAPYATLFTLDFHEAIVRQLPDKLASLAPAALSQANLGALGSERGVYQLFRGSESVYVGKSETPLAERLGQHMRRCSGRLNISLAEMSFRCLYVDDFVDAAAPERLLIKKYKAEGLAPWNASEGFGAKDVGRKRDRGEPGSWFIQHPVDYEYSFPVAQGGQRIALLVALKALKDAVPFDLFRYASSRSEDARDRQSAATDYPGRYVVLPDGPAPILAHLQPILDQLPLGWQATVLPHGTILYKERDHHYDYAMDGLRRASEGVQPLR